jgi:hypothetical protein
MVDEISDRHAHEDDYFRRRDQELIEKLKEDARKRAERGRLAEAAGVPEDHGVLNDLQALGWTPDLLGLMHLIPLVRVAWGDGTVQPRERELILEAARAHGIAEGSPAHARLLEALNVRPTEQEFARAMKIVAALLDALPSDKKTSGKRTLVSLASDIASATGGVFGFGSRVSPAEAATLGRIAAELEKSHGAAAADVVKKA